LRAVTRLLILAPNWLGDAVMALPAIADVRRALPDTRLTVAARGSVAPLFALVPAIDEPVVIDAPHRVRTIGGWRDIGRELRDQGPWEAALLLPNSFRAALMASRAGIPERWGYRTDWRGRLLTRAVAPPRRVHQVDYYRELVRALGFPNGAAEPVLAVGEAPRAAAREILRNAGWDGRTPLVALAPGAAYGGAKRWPPASFAELANGLARDGVACVLVGSPGDAATGREVAAAAGASLLDVIGRTDLPALAGVFALSRAVVSNDSGAMHVAAAVGTPVTAVFGPTDERATAPRAPHVTVLTHAVWCRPCMMRECPIDHRCMRGIRADRVLRTLRAS
jgi:lipopolysaccharide heptosyltransferase II